MIRCVICGLSGGDLLYAQGILRSVTDALQRPLPPQVFGAFTMVLRTPQLRTVKELSSTCGAPLGGLARACLRNDLPRPKEWLMLAHALHVATALRAKRSTTSWELAEHLGYPDPFCLSRALFTTTGWRIGELRDALDDEVIIQRWLHHCAKRGFRKTKNRT